jgi:hypothetical protein
MLSFRSQRIDTRDLSPWWVKITTATPHCLYYFGPFDSFEEARDKREGYLEDIEAEGARGIGVSIEPGNPHSLTIFEEVPETSPCHARPYSRSII